MAIVPDFDPTTPSIARVYDYLLDGKDNFAVDREVAERLKAVAPLAVEVTRENRQFLARAVAWAANRGIAQFIDLGCGMPTAPNTHRPRGQSPRARGWPIWTTTRWCSVICARWPPRATPA